MSSEQFDSITAMRAALQDGRTDAGELVEQAIARAQGLSSYNLFTALDGAGARAAAARAGDGPLAGIPLVIKDNINTGGLCSSAGCEPLAAGTPVHDAPVIARLRAAGAIILGKTNMHELAFGITSNNPFYGPCRNPYDPDRIPGGSSGGTGAAVAARVAVAGLGTDTGGSCRIPAALCGCVGFRPTLGRWPAAAVVPISATRDTPGPLTLNVPDAALLDTVCADDATPMPVRDPASLRLGIARRFFFEDLDPEVATVVAGAVSKLADAGCELVDVDLAEAAALSEQVGFTIVFYEVLRDLGYYLACHRPGLGVREVIEGVRTPGLAEALAAQLSEAAVPVSEYHAALAGGRQELRACYARCFADAGVDALLVPTTPLPARPIGQEDTVELNGRQVPTFQTYIRNTDPASNAGLPAISLPCGLSADTLPVGLELVGADGNDRALLGVAAAVEQVLGRIAPPA